MSIRLKFSGFEDLLSQIEQAGGTIDRAAESCLKQSAQIMQSELKTQMKESGVSNSLISRMPPPSIERDGNTYIARVGYKPTAYDAKNPSDYMKAVFLNYGTPKRSKHGKVNARGFINKAKKNASGKIKKAQKEALEKILGRLSK